MNNIQLKEAFDNSIPFTTRTGLKAIEMKIEGIKLVMPFEPNENHVGTMYAGALFTLAEMMGGAAAMVYLMKDGMYPIVKGLDIKFTKPARTDITTEYKMEHDYAERIIAECEKNDKANYSIELELKDIHGNVVAVSKGQYQLRKGVKL